MRAVFVEVPPRLLEERRRLGHDRWDEIWEGVLHMVPPPSGAHQRLGTQLLRLLLPAADAAGLISSYETGVWREEDDYRVPDLVFVRPDHVTPQGARGAEVVVEIRSPEDETYEKLDFYASVGVAEVLVVHPGDRRVELFVLRGSRLFPALPDPSGRLRSEALAVSFRTVEGPALEVTPDGGASSLI